MERFLSTETIIIELLLVVSAVPIFVTFLAFRDAEVAQIAKMAVWLDSILAGSLSCMITKAKQEDSTIHLVKN